MSRTKALAVVSACMIVVAIVALWPSERGDESTAEGETKRSVNASKVSVPAPDEPIIGFPPPPEIVHLPGPEFAKGDALNTVISVIDQDGNPVEGAEVRDDKGASSLVGRTDSNGVLRVFFTRFDTRIMPLFIWAKGFAPAEVWVSAGAAHKRVMLSRGLTVAGYVEDRLGVRLAGASVQIGPQGAALTTGSWGHEQMTTGASGEFLFECQPRMPVVLRATHEGYTPKQVVLPLSALGTPVQVVMASGSDLKVLVVNAGGIPIPGAHVSCLAQLKPDARNLQLDQVVSAEDGIGTLRGLPQQLLGLWIEVRAPGLVPVTKVLRGEALSTPFITVKCAQAACVLRGRIVDARGRGVPGQVIVHRYVKMAKEFAGMDTTRTDSKGKFEIETISPGERFFLTAHWIPPDASTNVGSLHTSEEMSLGEGETREVTLSTPSMVRFTLRCRDDAGNAVPGVTIFAESKDTLVSSAVCQTGTLFRACTAADGGVRLSLPEGDYKIVGRIGLRPVARTECSVVSGMSEFVVKVGQTSSVKGRLISAHGEPKSGKLVQIFNNEFAQSTLTDDAGAFSFQWIPPTSLTLWAEGPRGEENGAVVENLLPGQGFVEVSIPEGAILAQVVDKASGKSLAGSFYFAKEGDRRLQQGRRSVTSWEGRFSQKGTIEIPEVSAGKWGVTVVCPGYLSHSELITVGSGTTSVRVRMIRGAYLSITEYPGDEMGPMTLTIRHENEALDVLRFTWPARDGQESPSFGPIRPGPLILEAQTGGGVWTLRTLVGTNGVVSVPWGTGWSQQ